MTRCAICEYYFQPDAGSNDDPRSCQVCRARTTLAQRMTLLRGHRLDHGFMDSD